MTPARYYRITPASKMHIQGARQADGFSLTNNPFLHSLTFVKPNGPTLVYYQKKFLTVTGIYASLGP